MNTPGLTWEQNAINRLHHWQILADTSNVLDEIIGWDVCTIACRQCWQTRRVSTAIFTTWGAKHMTRGCPRPPTWLRLLVWTGWTKPPWWDVNDGPAWLEQKAPHPV